MCDSLDPFVNADGYVRECWKCGFRLTHEDDHVRFCPECGSPSLVPYGDRFLP
jgi:Zn finger protein HypA/HybF involved in hydrogenase expression